ncbi:MAG: hypothetical protein GTO63_18800 [Anaerolineae bacterium]|nr:hypothetical protein [Anaerolineae bacterium]NIN96822.1 hypothetical protein [Anaerolineae bacterium]NIQ79806.1 hypothetical protein [Anaerolineae bacterium]
MWQSGWTRKEAATPCDSMDDQELVSRVLELRLQLHDLDRRHEQMRQRLGVPTGQSQDGLLELTKEDIGLTRERDTMWEQQQHFLNGIRRRGLDEILAKAVQADDAQRKQERHDD